MAGPRYLHNISLPGHYPQGSGHHLGRRRRMQQTCRGGESRNLAGSGGFNVSMNVNHGVTQQGCLGHDAHHDPTFHVHLWPC